MKKLSIHRETLRALNVDALQGVDGGMAIEPTTSLINSRTPDCGTCFCPVSFAPYRCQETRLVCAPVEM